MNPEAPRKTELEELLIDAEADDDSVQQAQPSVVRPWLLLLGLVLVALNLRPALSSLSPLLAEVSSSLGLSAAKAGLLTEHFELDGKAQTELRARGIYEARLFHA